MTAEQLNRHDLPKGSERPCRGDGTAPSRVACLELLRENGFPYRKFLFLILKI